MKNDSALANLTETLQTLDLNALLLAVTGDVNLALLFKAELANRGLGYSGEWLGFDKVHEEIFSEGELSELEICAEEELFRDGRARNNGARLGSIRKALLKKQSARKLATVVARKARQEREARFEAAAVEA